MLDQVERDVKPLDISTIENINIPWFVQVFDIASSQWVFVPGLTDTRCLLMATASSPPFYPALIKVNNRWCVDGGSLRNASLLRLIDSHPELDFVYVMNLPDSHGKIMGNIFNYIVSILNIRTLGCRAGMAGLLKHHRVNLSALASRSNVKIIANDLGGWIGMTDRDKLLKLYRHGLKKGQQYLQKIGLETE